MSHIRSKIVSRNIQINETDARNYSVPSCSRTFQSEAARMISAGVQASMAPNAMACGVVMDCSQLPTHEPNDLELNSELRGVGFRPSLDIKAS